MRSSTAICPRNTTEAALAVLRSQARDPAEILRQIRSFGVINITDLPFGRPLSNKSPSQIKVALVRPLGSLSGDEEREAVKEMGEPFQLEILASVLRARGYQVRIFDQLAGPYDPTSSTVYPRTKSSSELVSEIAAWGPDVAGFSTFTYNFRSGLSIAAEVKKRLGVPILFGGYHVTGVGKQHLLFDRLPAEHPEANSVIADAFKEDLRVVFQHGVVDYACVGEGIYTFPEILSVLRGEKDAHEVSGIAFTERGKLFVTEPGTVSIDSYPSPLRAMDFDPMRYYATGRGYPFLLLMTSKGCRFSCEYCSTGAMNYPGYLPRPIDVVIQELQEIRSRFDSSWPSRNRKIMVNIIDEDFAANPRRVIKLCNTIVAAGLHHTFQFNSFMDNLSILNKTHGHEMLAAMKRAGFVFCFVGVESMLDEVVNGYHRPDKFQDRLASVQAAIDRMAEHGIMYFGDFIAGYPLHAMADIHEDYSRILRLRNMHYAYFPLLAPMPGTPLYWRALAGMFREGFLPGITYDQLDANHQVLGIVDGGDVKPIRDFFVQRFFSRPEYMDDAQRLIAADPDSRIFFAILLRKIIGDYPDNPELQKVGQLFHI